MGRLQLALNVDDVDAAVDFYRRLFGTEPAKRRPGYANFAIWDPPLKLVLIEKKGAGATLNHLGVEVRTPEEVAAHETRLEREGLAPVRNDGVCCHADQAKVWVHDPDGAPWEVYAVLADAPPGPHGVPGRPDAAALCCVPAPTSASGSASLPLAPPTPAGADAAGCCAGPTAGAMAHGSCSTSR